MVIALFDRGEKNHESPTRVVHNLGPYISFAPRWICPPDSAGMACRIANGQSQVETPAGSSSIHVKHVLGFEGVRRNASGELSIQGDDLSFQRNGKPAAQVKITSIRNISLGEEDNQVGGLPMTLGKTAVPFGGGRVVSLFSHKKYDSLAIGYLDSSSGFHGAVFLLTKGQGKTIKSELIARGAQITPSEDPVPIRTTPEESLKAAEEWSVQVERTDPGATTLDPSFSDAIYENMLKELPKAKKFKRVFRSGDRNANDASDVLVLKTLVEKYSPGSETRRAVTTIAGATKLKVRIQLLTRMAASCWSTPSKGMSGSSATICGRPTK